MANRLPKEISEFMEKYSVGADEVWPVPGGKAYAVKHKALERIAIAQKITFERPAIIGCDLVEKSMVVCVFGKMGDREEWTFGEASPGNNKNQYFAAMTEKRAKDRVILKLLSAHGDLYSEDEAEDFKQRPNPHVTRPEDVFTPVERDQHGQPVDNIPAPSPEAIKKLRVVDQRPIFEAMQKEIWATTKISQLQLWAEENKDRLGSLKPDWQDFLRGVYAEHRDSIRQLDAGDDMRMAG
jgi:hypothetical protein